MNILGHKTTRTPSLTNGTVRSHAVPFTYRTVIDMVQSGNQSKEDSQLPCVTHVIRLQMTNDACKNSFRDQAKERENPSQIKPSLASAT